MFRFGIARSTTNFVAPHSIHVETDRVIGNVCTYVRRVIGNAILTPRPAHVFDGET